MGIMNLCHLNTLVKMNKTVSNNWPNSENFLRLAILQFEKGLLKESWQFASRALMMDTSIEKRKRPYQHYVERIIRGIYGPSVSVNELISKIRSSKVSASHH